MVKEIWTKVVVGWLGHRPDRSFNSTLLVDVRNEGVSAGFNFHSTLRSKIIGSGSCAHFARGGRDRLAGREWAL